ncbi:MAG TPA: HAMP domain-containing sensor histidine kinase [Longimicrobiales bacterium]
MGLARDPGSARALHGPGEPAFISGSVTPPRPSPRAPAAWNEILAMVAHDLRNPLNAISLAATLTLESASARDEETARRMETILRASGRMNRLIGDLLDAAVLEAGVLTLELRRGSAAAILDEAAGDFLERARACGVELSCVDLGAPPLLADSRRLAQALANLIENAMRVTPPGGRILVRADRWDGWARFTVSDSGPGIAPEDIPHVFERFWHTCGRARGAAGLGLAVARKIVEAHGGRIWVESQPGSGARFVFTVPAAPRAGEASARAHVKRAPSLPAAPVRADHVRLAPAPIDLRARRSAISQRGTEPGRADSQALAIFAPAVQPGSAAAVPTRAVVPSRTVLIISGSEDERLIWSAILEHYGYVPEAIPLAGAAPDAFAPDLIVVALDRFDSSRATLLNSLRGASRFAGVPIIGIIDPDVHPSEPLRAGCAGVLVRPIRPAALRAEVDRLIGPPTAPQA